MAGSYTHVTQRITTENGKLFFIGPILLDHLGDATESLTDLWFMTHYLAGDDETRLKEAFVECYRPSTPIAKELKRRLAIALENEFWEGELDEVRGEDGFWEAIDARDNGEAPEPVPTLTVAASDLKILLGAATAALDDLGWERFENGESERGKRLVEVRARLRKQLGLEDEA